MSTSIAPMRLPACGSTARLGGRALNAEEPRNRCPFPHVPVLSKGGSHGRQTVKTGATGPVSYQHKRRLRSTLLVSEVRRLARAAQSGRQESGKLGQSGREGAEGQRSFIVAHDISDRLVGTQILMHGSLPECAFKSAAHCWTEGPGPPPATCY